ncbi:GNAT family N-acetyltransferase [Paenibacillus woosongensis]|uniref:GNAT family N-acetyltransferase n=1 Tax=Paenibacillus woosongensis TaxID=307580 RepID=A0A7X2YXS5_9BACL|nr:GNAT family N-acetyltransferase [Paenibacillus woosongensis]MUG43936.1 GNAT family N-acetyltransferase [Paenibacillus woosongensis]
MIRYRRPKQDDPVIINLVKKELVPHSSMSRPELEKAIRDIPRRLTQGITLVASPYYEADPVAFIHFMIHGDLLYIDMMAVASQHQRKRHGKTLMAHAENLAGSRGCTTAKVLVDQENTRAHLFYQKSGYETIRYIPVSRCFELEKRLLLRL